MGNNVSQQTNEITINLEPEMSAYKVGDIVESYVYTINGKYSRGEESLPIPTIVSVQIIPATIICENADGTYEIEERISPTKTTVDKIAQEKYLYPPNSFTEDELLKKIR